jgi:three-Cys-motif partner protein
MDYPLIYVDGFAGPGRFEDGKPGSPLIALDEIENSNAKLKTKVYLVDREKEYTDQLKKNTATFTTDHVIINDEYQNCIQDIIDNSAFHNLFCYLDPFGSMDINFQNLLDLNSRLFGSTEVLLNLNSFGFYRDACRLLGKECNDSETPDEAPDDTNLPEAEAMPMSISSASNTAGGSYWESLVRKYQPLHEGYEFENEFSDAFCKQLRKSYRYVLNIPIRIKTRRIPKYRMIHCTNHHQGCVLMYDNICKRKKELLDIQNGSQITFLQETFDHREIIKDEVKRSFLDHLRKYKTAVHIDECFADFFISYGISLPLSDFNTFIKEFREANEIQVISPTTKSGKPSTALKNAKIIGKV